MEPRTVIEGRQQAGTKIGGDARRLGRRARVPAMAGALALAAALLAGDAALAQTATSSPISRPVVQPLPSGDSLRLSAALSRLGRDPRDIDALIDAGNAALAMGDADAAVGFFKRADQVSSRDPRVKAGLAGAMVRKGDPFSAIPLFDEAERAGAAAGTIASDRGLAYDLVGDNDTAQRHYKLALARAADPSVTMRLALSQAIMGDRRASEATLTPLLRDQDKAAWRTRAFALAILGQPEEAVRITRTILPEELAAAIAPYLRYMPTLTPAQQAAAANLGNFPRASEIGRDDPRVAQFAPPGGFRQRVAAVDSALVPRGEPLGSGTRSRKDEKAARKAKREREESARLARAGDGKREGASSRVAPPDPRPERQAAAERAGLVPSRDADARPVTSAVPAVSRPPVAVVARPEAPAQSAGAEMAAVAAAEVAQARPVVAVARPPQPAAATTPVATPSAGTASVVAAPAAAASAPAAAPAAPRLGAASPGFDLARIAPANSPPAAAPAPAPSPAVSPPALASVAPSAGQAPPTAPEPSAEAPVSLADAFSDLGRPSVNRAPAAGAVDITRIKPARPKPDPDKEKAKADAEKAKAEKAKPAPPSHPSRIWVQLGVGRDKKALAYDWRKYARQAPDLFKGRKGHVSDMGSTNRLLVGPFESAKAANAFLAAARKADFGGAHMWTSPAGQVVDPL